MGWWKERKYRNGQDLLTNLNVQFYCQEISNKPSEFRK